MKIFAIILLFSLAFADLKPKHCRPCDTGTSVDELNEYRKKVEYLMKEFESVSKLHKSCLSERFIVLTALHFSEGHFSFDREEFVNYDVFFRGVKDLKICGTEHFLPDSWPTDRDFPDFKPIFDSLRSLNPVLYSDQVDAWSYAFSLLKSYLTQCVSKDHPLDQDFFNKYGPGQDIANVTFLPKSRNFVEFSFKHRFLPELRGFKEDSRMYTDALKDSLKYVEQHFTARVFVPTTGETGSITESGLNDPLGFQVLWVKKDYPFRVLHNLELRGNVNGNLSVYVFEGNGKLREVETLRNIRTEGNAIISLREFNLNLNDKDIVLFDIEGEGSLSKGSLAGNVGRVLMKNIVLINKSIARNRFKNPKVGQMFEVENAENGVDAVLELAREKEVGKRRSPIVMVEERKEKDY